MILDMDELQKIVDYVYSQGVRYADIRADNTLITRIQVRNGEIRVLKSSQELGLGLRVLVNGSWGFTTAIDVASLKKQIKSVISLTRNSAKHNSSVTEIDDLRSCHAKICWPAKVHPDKTTIEEKIDFVIEANNRPKKTCPQISSVTTSYTERQQTRQFVNTEKRQIQHSHFRTTFGVHFVGKEQAIIVERSCSMGGIGGLEAVPYDDAIGLVEKETETVKRLLRADAAPSGNFPAVLNYELSYTLAHEAFGHLCEGDSVIRGDSILEGKLGSKVASDSITIIDDPTQYEPNGRPAFGSFPYDDEGVKASPTVLVDKGTLVSYMHSRESAKKLAQPLTGNGRAESAKRRPQVRMSNTYFMQGDATQEELFEEVKNGLYLVDSRGGQTTGQGTYHVGVQLAYEIRNGRIGQLLRGTAIGGRTLETLSHIRLIAKDIIFGIGACGKGDPTQTVFTGTNCPEISINKLTIGG
ncbi:MAG: TldD/PmbA family protein [Candidatus Ranarchaeia archaeon]